MNFLKLIISGLLFLGCQPKHKEIGNQEKQSSHKKTRRLANSDRLIYSKVFSNDTQELNKAILAVKTHVELAELIEEYEEKYDSLSTQAKWVAAQLVSLKPLRGMITRVRGLIEKSENGAFVHSQLVAMLRATNAGINSFNPDGQWKAGFDYTVIPYFIDKKNKVVVPNIKTEKELFLYVKNELTPALQLYSDRIEKLAILAESEPFYFDNKLLFNSQMNIIDDQDRFVAIDKGVAKSLSASIKLSLSATKYSLAYSWKGLLRAISSIAGSYGFHAVLDNEGAMIAKKRIERITKKSKFKDLYKRRDLISDVSKDEILSYTKSAYDDLDCALDYSKQAWEFIKASDSKQEFQSFPLFDVRSFMPFNRIIGNGFDNLDDLMDGQKVSSTIIQGETVQVKFKDLFESPPSDFKNFLATGFNVPNVRKILSKSDDKELKDPITGRFYRNYDYGNPNAWNYSFYTKYFPDAKDEKGVRNSARILSQIWGGTIMGATLSSVLF